MHENLVPPSRSVTHTIDASLYVRDNEKGHSVCVSVFSVLFESASADIDADAAPAIQRLFSHFHAADTAFPTHPGGCQANGFFGTARLPFSLWLELRGVYLEERTHRLHAKFRAYSIRDVAEGIAKNYNQGHCMESILAVVEKGQDVFVADDGKGGACVVLGQRPPQETLPYRIFPSRD